MAILIWFKKLKTIFYTTAFLVYYYVLYFLYTLNLKENTD